MTDARFEKLVNLYLDKEITPSELSDLKAEIAHNLVRRQKFERLCRVHSASRKALINQSVRSGVKTFLHNEIATVESRRGQKSRIRKAKTETEAQQNARDLLWRATAAFVAVILTAGLTTAYVIERTANTYMTAEKEKDEGMDASLLQGRVAVLGKSAEGLILASMPQKETGTVSELFIVRWQNLHENDPLLEAGVKGYWTFEEIHSTLSPMETFKLQMELKGCAGQMPGTSAPAAIPMPSEPVIVTGEQHDLRAVSSSSY